MVTIRTITYEMKNHLGFNFKTHYKPTVFNFNRPFHVSEPIITEIEGPAVEIPESKIKCRSFFESIS